MGILQTVLDLLILTHISMHTLYHTCRGSLRAVYWQWHTYFVLQIIPYHLLFRASSLCSARISLVTLFGGVLSERRDVQDAPFAPQAMQIDAANAFICSSS